MKSPPCGKNSPDSAGNGIAECVHGSLLWNQVDEIFHGYVLDVETEFGGHRTKLEDSLSQFQDKKDAKTRPLC